MSWRMWMLWLGAVLLSLTFVLSWGERASAMPESQRAQSHSQRVKGSQSHSQQSLSDRRAGTWSWPVENPRTVIRDFEAPLTPYSAGHRGLDIEANVSTEVRAPADGIVSFSGRVVDRGVLSLAVGDYTASFEPIDALVTEGDFVKRGDVIGLVATGPHCQCLHVGARKGENYLSPMAFFSEIPMAVLMPWSDP